MHPPQSDQSSSCSVSLSSTSEAGPSSLILDKGGRSNGFTNGNGFVAPMANGSTKSSPSIGNGIPKHTSITRVSLPGTTLYEDSFIDREEFVRLVIQSLRDVGYMQSAATLEAESGYSLEAEEVAEFRQYILNAEWTNAEALLPSLIADDDMLWDAMFLIGKQKYLELLEARKTTAALQVLREQLAPLSVDSSEQLHALSRLVHQHYIAYDLRRRALWDGASPVSRQALLIELQRLDRKVIAWDASGKQVEEWPGVPVRVTDMAVTHDMRRLVVIGMGYQPNGLLPADGLASRTVTRDSPPPSGTGVAVNAQVPSDNRIVVYDLKTKATELLIPTEGELTSVKISSDSRFAIVNHAPDAIHLFDLDDGHIVWKFTGQRQRQHVIRSCFGGVDGNFVVSGSEDRNVYVWHRDTGVLLEVLAGHGSGSVNCVAWNPCNERMFASCSDDCTIRIWEPSPPVESSVSASSVNDVSVNGKGKGRVSSWGESAIHRGV
ncbi:hypothetical protein ID866_3881 [Astraeus odoratus]|nr:hypothetical protein ID866_3881 [Astraeus odoratus]